MLVVLGEGPTGRRERKKDGRGREAVERMSRMTVVASWVLEEGGGRRVGLRQRQDAKADEVEMGSRNGWSKLLLCTATNQELNLISPATPRAALLYRRPLTPLAAIFVISLNKLGLSKKNLTF
jgi:hypothetical protein